MQTIAGIGTDIIRISRIEVAGMHWQDKFIRRVFTEGEIDYCSKRKNKWVHLAGRFAAKESIKKAISPVRRKLSNGVKQSGEGLRWKDIEIIANIEGGPSIRFSKRGDTLIKTLGIRGAFISLSHDGDYATAQAIAIGVEE